MQVCLFPVLLAGQEYVNLSGSRIYVGKMLHQTRDSNDKSKVVGAFTTLGMELCHRGSFGL